VPLVTDATAAASWASALDAASCSSSERCAQDDVTEAAHAICGAGRRCPRHLCAEGSCCHTECSCVIWRSDTSNGASDFLRRRDCFLRAPSASLYMCNAEGEGGEVEGEGEGATYYANELAQRLASPPGDVS